MPDTSPGAVAAQISYDDFRRIDVRVGTVTAVEPYPEARKPAYKMTIDFGPEIGTRRSSAQVTVRYRAEEILGKQVAAVVNFPPKQIGRFRSEVLVLGFPDAEGEVVMIAPSLPVPNGGRLY